MAQAQEQAYTPVFVAAAVCIEPAPAEAERRSACAPGWKSDAPHFGQKETLSFTSALQLGQRVTSDLPQPVQYVSPGS